MSEQRGLMRPWVVRGFSEPKRHDTPNEDRWAVSDDACRVAISDGASISFDSGPWANLLVQKFLEEPVPDAAWLAAGIKEYEKAYDRDSMPWMNQAAFDRGSFATLLGLVIDPDGSRIGAFAIGDSLFAIVVDNQLIATVPYSDPSEFDAAPLLFSTSHLQNVDLFKVMDAGWYSLPIPETAPVLLLMTDAIGRWLLDEPAPERIDVLTSIGTEEEFRAFVHDERCAGRMRVDDATLIIMRRAS